MSELKFIIEAASSVLGTSDFVASDTTVCFNEPDPEDPAKSLWVGAALQAEIEALAVTLEASAPVTFPPLMPYQFWTAVRATGHEADLHAWVEAMTDPIEKSYASAVLEFSLEFRYDHPLMQVALQVLGLTVEEFQTLWLWALDL